MALPPDPGKTRRPDPHPTETIPVPPAAGPVAGVPTGRTPTFVTPVGADTPAPADRPDPPVPGELIARGGMGSVWRVHDAQLGRDVAMKLLLEEHRDTPLLCRRFVREGRLTGRLQHPGIVPVYELGRLPDGRPYFTMKLIGGRTLADLLTERRDPQDDLPRLLKAFETVAQALAYAHARRVIHRDLKPANVMVGEFGEVLVMDWGVAKALADSPDEPADGPIDGQADPTGTGQLTVTGSVLGTPAYMPPEQARGEIERVSERSDVFGLGTILCHVLTGHPPYDGADGATLIRAARRADLTAAFARLDGCRGPGPLIALTRRCLATDPADRPPHAGVVAAAVTAYLETELRRAERDLVRFFELSMDLFCIAGLDGYFHRVNANFSRVLGYSTAELVSRPFLDYIHPDDRPATVAVMADMANGVPCVRFCNRYVDAGGSYRWFEWTAKSIPEEGVIFAAARDVTAEKNGDPRPPASA